MNLRQLEYFVRVAELGSFSKAALILNIAQPALSRQVRLLETDLHVTLLTRTGRGVVLTEVGQRLPDRAAPTGVGVKDGATPFEAVVLGDETLHGIGQCALVFVEVEVHDSSLTVP